MARWLLFFLIAAFALISVIETAPAQEETSPSNKIEDSVKQAIEKISQSFKDLMEDPKISEFYKEGQKAFENAAEKLKTEAAKLIPKTDESTE
ncbi:uncharacterized protein LOC130670960 [Microplitis mediator]|uniref:uncharacterized protein LOC130670960 n=1 Tax=Microplitis mediator TaxID=375433 RepID=UPI002552B3A7|nr:uncharacterized protein LOC130670960 [Microplitis mediator]